MYLPLRPCWGRGGGGGGVVAVGVSASCTRSRLGYTLPLPNERNTTQARCKYAYVADAVKTIKSKSHPPQFWLVGWLFTRLRTRSRLLFPLVRPVGLLAAIPGRLSMGEERSGVISVRVAKEFPRGSFSSFFFSRTSRVIRQLRRNPSDPDGGFVRIMWILFRVPDVLGVSMVGIVFFHVNSLGRTGSPHGVSTGALCRRWQTM